MDQPAASCATPPGKKGRSRLGRILKWAGIAFGALLLLLALAALFVVYKATRKFPLEIIDVVPPDAVAYAEFENLASSWPQAMEFLDAVRKSPRYKTAVRTDPMFREIRVDEKIDSALAALSGFKEKSGVDPFEAAFGYKTAVAVFADPAPAPAAGRAGAGTAAVPGVKFTFAAFTFLTGLKVRIAALFADPVLSRAAPEGMEISDCGGFTGVKVKTPSGPEDIYFAVLKDLLVVSNRRSAMESVLQLSSSGISGSLGARPEFRDAFVAQDSGCICRYWVDFKAADSLLDIRKKSEVKVSTFPFVYIGRYLNGAQRGVVDLENAVSISGTVRLEPGSGTIRTDGRMIYAGGKFNPFLVRTYGLEAAEPFDSRVAPAGTACSFSVRKDWRELWDQLGYEGDADSRESFLKLNESFADAFTRIAANLGSDFAVFFKASPFAGPPRQGFQPPLPWLCLAAVSPDPEAVAGEISGIFNSQIEKFAAKAPPSEVPILKTESLEDARITYVDNLPMEVRSEVSPDFKPGFFTRGSQIVVFTSLEFAKEVIGATSRRGLLAGEEGYAQARASVGDKSSLSLFVDGDRLFSLMASYRLLLAEEMRPLDWKEGNRIIEQTYGRNLPPDQMKMRQDAYEAAVRKKQGEIAAKLAQRFENLKFVKTFALSCRYAANEVNKTPSGLEYSLAVILDLD